MASQQTNDIIVGMYDSTKRLIDMMEETNTDNARNMTPNPIGNYKSLPPDELQMMNCNRTVLYKWSLDPPHQPYIKLYMQDGKGATFSDLRAQMHQHDRAIPYNASLFIVDESDGTLELVTNDQLLPEQQKTPMKIYVCPARSSTRQCWEVVIRI